MRLAILTAALLAIPTHAGWRLESGLSFSRLGNTDTLGVEFSSYAAPSLGLAYEHSLGRSFCFLPGISLEEKGEKLTATFSEYIKLSYVQLPLLFGYRRPAETGPAWSLTAGPELGWRWKSRIQGAFRDYDAHRDIKRFDFGAKLGAAIEFPGRQAGLILGLSYFHGFINPHPQAGDLANRNLKILFGARI
jgi:hypothetical protein